jgi:hypothetical protein
MKRIMLLLAVVAAMVTVLVFAAPAFAVAGSPGAPILPKTSQPDGPPENSGPPGKLVDPQAADTQAPDVTLGGFASEFAVADATVHGVPFGHHILVDTGYTPGECAQNPLPCIPPPQ